MLSVVIIDQIIREEERRRQERQTPAVRVPVDDILEREPAREDAAETLPVPATTVVVLEVSQDSLEAFRVLTW